MNAFRKARTLSLVLLVALVAVSFAANSAQAGGGCHSYCSYPSYCSSSYCSYPSYCNTSYCQPSYCYTNYCNYGYNYCNYAPTTYCLPQQTCFPVTVYDCYGRPTIVWQTSYGVKLVQ